MTNIIQVRVDLGRLKIRQNFERRKVSRHKKLSRLSFFRAIVKYRGRRQ
jgi:hypothetical protein